MNNDFEERSIDASEVPTHALGEEHSLETLVCGWERGKVRLAG